MAKYSLSNPQPYIGFTYNIKTAATVDQAAVPYHSITDLKIYRTSNGNRYSESITPAMTDKVVDVPGSDGQYYFGTTFKNRTFTIDYAFDSLTQTEINTIKKIFSGDGIYELVFDEDRDSNGYAKKIWSAKVTGTVTMKHLCFEEKINGKIANVYKGEGSITFTCYYPYARSEKIEIAKGQAVNNKTYQPTNKGDFPAPIVIDFSYTHPSNATSNLTCYGFVFSDGSGNAPTKQIKFSAPKTIQKGATVNYLWDSKSGIVYSISGTKKTIIPTMNSSIWHIQIGHPIGHFGQSPIMLMDSATAEKSNYTAAINQDSSEFREIYR